MQAMFPYCTDNSVYHFRQNDYHLNDYGHFPLSEFQQLSTSDLAGIHTAEEPSIITDMDTWAKTISLDSDTQPLLEDNNNNNFCPIVPQLSQECKYEEVSLSDFSLDDSSHQPPSEPPKQVKRLGRPPGRRSKRSGGKEKPPGRLWKFILKCLEDPSCNPTIIAWVDKSRGMFRFVQSDKVAQRWGDVKRNPNMTYEKMSRALRYYKSGAFAPISQRLVYAFGKNVPWNTNSGSGSGGDRRVECPR